MEKHCPGEFNIYLFTCSAPGTRGSEQRRDVNRFVLKPVWREARWTERQRCLGGRQETVLVQGKLSSKWGEEFYPSSEGL